MKEVYIKTIKKDKKDFVQLIVHKKESVNKKTLDKCTKVEYIEPDTDKGIPVMYYNPDTEKIYYEYKEEIEEPEIETKESEL